MQLEGLSSRSGTIVRSQPSLPLIDRLSIQQRAFHVTVHPINGCDVFEA